MYIGRTLCNPAQTIISRTSWSKQSYCVLTNSVNPLEGHADSVIDSVITNRCAWFVAFLAEVFEVVEQHMCPLVLNNVMQTQNYGCIHITSMQNLGDAGSTRAPRQTE